MSELRFVSEHEKKTPLMFCCSEDLAKAGDRLLNRELYQVYFVGWTVHVVMLLHIAHCETENRSSQNASPSRMKPNILCCPQSLERRDWKYVQPSQQPYWEDKRRFNQRLCIPWYHSSEPTSSIEQRPKTHVPGERIGGAFSTSDLKTSACFPEHQMSLEPYLNDRYLANRRSRWRSM